MLVRHQRAWAALALALAGLSVVGAQVRSLAWYRAMGPTGPRPVFDGWVTAWERAVGWTLGWASPEAVHLTLGKLCGPTLGVMAAICWLMYRRHRRSGPTGLAWLAALGSLTLASAAYTLEFWLQWGQPLPAPWGDALAAASWWATIAAVASSTALGAVWLNTNQRPRLAGWCLASAGPALLVWLLIGIGLPLLPVIVGFGLAAHRILRIPDQRFAISPRAHRPATPKTAPVPVPAGTAVLTALRPEGPGTAWVSKKTPGGFVHYAA